MKALARKVFIPILCVVAGAVIGFAIHDRVRVEQGCRGFTEVRDQGYRFISPLLECDADWQVLRGRALRPFKESVEAGLRDLAADGAAPVSVYFRELNDGIWFSINEEEQYEPASVRKIPMMIAILKQAERDPELLFRSVVARLREDYDAHQTFRPSRPLELGKEYPIGELVTRMIVQSDNNAFMLLGGVVDARELAKVYGLLSMRPASASWEESRFSVLTYAAFFRVLYNGTYLTKEMSDLALEQLAESEFRSGLVAGVPNDVIVAHKFGERSSEDGRKQLHDCGIVYYPGHPYLLCVMAKGSNFDSLARAIASISRTVYDQIRLQHSQ